MGGAATRTHGSRNRGAAATALATGRKPWQKGNGCATARSARSAPTAHSGCPHRSMPFKCAPSLTCAEP
eukprot:357937-Chlamydomonas_euryale.AAC.1